MGMIFNLQKFCTKDGPGIRTTVFFKGCPLRCVWCHNPESHSSKPELLYDCTKNKCSICGYETTADEVIQEVSKDKPFYETSGGGITLSGGEPLFQPEFCLELLKKAKENQLHICMETCGFASDKLVAETAEYVDLYLYDCKETDPEKHKKYTGAANQKILENLRLLDSLGKKIILRCPIIPGCNDREEHLEKIAQLADTLEHVVGVELEPYHPMGIGKAEELGKKQPYQNHDFIDKKELEKYRKIFQKKKVKVWI